MDLNNCRSIAITPVLYRMAMQVVKDRLQRWDERKGVLGELQAGFRVGRRIEDNLFVLTQCIEIALQTGNPLYVAFLDISKAYDRVNQELLWELLREHGLDEPDLCLLQALYEVITAQVEWGGVTTAPVEIPRSLRQGCPLPPLLFMLYVAEVTNRLEFSGSGYQLEHRVEGQLVVCCIPALVYADDFAVMAGSPEELQHLLDICGTEVARLQLQFSQAKCMMLVWGAAKVHQRTWALQGDTVHMQGLAKYLGMHLTTGPDYLATHERHIKTKAARKNGFLGQQALWAFNRYDVLRALWKMVAVPGLTYANATLCISAGTREFLERWQRDAGRMALGIHRRSSVEGIQGDLGWSSFTAREAVAKLSYEARLLRLPDTNFAHQTLIHTIYSGTSTWWTRRTANLRRRFDVSPESYPCYMSVSKGL